MSNTTTQDAREATRQEAYVWLPIDRAPRDGTIFVAETEGWGWPRACQFKAEDDRLPIPCDNRPWSRPPTRYLALTADGAGEREWPNIGDDPMKGPRVDDRYEASRLRLRAAYVKQQPEVPNQTALVWRYDLGTVLEMAIRLQAILADATPSPIGGASMPAVAPIDMLLFCPKCGLQHIDWPDDRSPEWDNPPHRSHLCHGCGCIWRPADVATNGVARIATMGKADTWGESNCAAPARFAQPSTDMQTDTGAFHETAGSLKVGEDAALASFTEYFVRNYPGPDTVIGRPEWHAPRIFRAALRALRFAQQSAKTEGEA